MPPVVFWHSWMVAVLIINHCPALDGAGQRKKSAPGSSGSWTWTNDRIGWSHGWLADVFLIGSSVPYLVVRCCWFRLTWNIQCWMYQRGQHKYWNKKTNFALRPFESRWTLLQRSREYMGWKKLPNVTQQFIFSPLKRHSIHAPRAVDPHWICWEGVLGEVFEPTVLSQELSARFPMWFEWEMVSPFICWCP